MPGSEQEAVRSEPPPSLLQSWSGCHAVACIQVQDSARRGPCHIVCCTQGLGSQAEAVAQLCTWVKGQPQLLLGEGPWLLHLAAVPQPKPREAAARALKLAVPALAPQTGRQQCKPCNAHPCRGLARAETSCRVLCWHVTQQGQPQVRLQAHSQQLPLSSGPSRHAVRWPSLPAAAAYHPRGVATDQTSSALLPTAVGLWPCAGSRCQLVSSPCRMQAWPPCAGVLHHPI